ncbi:MAG TPA: phytanoyl-CoA dioxygenase family protein [Rhodanobacteraceae bacterium]|nr:phytanoyl-CoA dioxygenase family protein [Rhodanobacteraceae bacterium]
MDGPQTGDAIGEWNTRGVLVLPGFYADAEIDVVLADYRALWNEGLARVTVDDMDLDRRMRLRDVSADARRSHRFKVNDLYLEQVSVRRLALGNRLVPLLQRLLGERPALCNSLSLEYGTEQPDHVDSLYMTPRTPSHLVAAWVALEDCSPESGLLRYWPGSHRIDPYVFSNGGRHFVPEEMDAWRTWMQAQLDERGLHSELFRASKGDVFIWNAQLLHGGSRIADPTRTRRSIVFHYFSEPDCRAMGSRLEAASGGFWVRRSHQPIPGSLHARLRHRAGRVAHQLRRLFSTNRRNAGNGHGH